MKIRPEQMTAFEQAAIRNFEQRMIHHLQEAFPKHCQILGQERLKNVIDYGWERAKSHGLNGENSIILFTDLTFLLGRGFDTDPQLPWAAELLKEQGVQDEATRTQTLYDKAIEYLTRVSGEKNEHIDAAQARIRDEKPEELAEAANSTQPEGLLGHMRKIFPQKYDYVGEPALREMLEEGTAAANNYGITDNGGIAVYVGLMYMLGASFDRDPQFSWAREVLTDSSIPDQKDRVARLYAAGLSYLEKWCA